MGFTLWPWRFRNLQQVAPVQLPLHWPKVYAEGENLSRGRWPNRFAWRCQPQRHLETEGCGEVLRRVSPAPTSAGLALCMNP